MTIDTGRGIDHALVCVGALIGREIPARIAAENAYGGAAIISPLAGPYTYAVNTVLSLYVDASATALETTISAGTYTAAQLAAELNADAAWYAVMTADAVLGGNHLRIKSESTAAGSIRVGASDTALGLVKDTIANWLPLRNLAIIRAQHEEVEPAAYPALLLRCEGMEIEAGGEMVSYSIRARLYETYWLSSAELVDALPSLLNRYAELITDAIMDRSSATVSDYSVNLSVSRITPGELQTNQGGIVRAFIDFDITATVEEDLANDSRQSR